MKSKRQAVPQKISTQNLVLLIIFIGLAVLIPTIGSIYEFPVRFTLPIAILLFWIGGAIALWTFRQGQGV
jgi:hypothetical protein